MANRYDDEFGRDREQRGRWDREHDRREHESGYGREGNYGRDFGRESRGREGNYGEGSRGTYGQGSYGQGTSYGQGHSGSYAGGGRSQWDRGDYAQGESSREYGRMYGEGSRFGARPYNEYPLGGAEGFHGNEGFRGNEEYRGGLGRHQDYRNYSEGQRGQEHSGYQGSRGWGEYRGTQTQTGNQGWEGRRDQGSYGGAMGSSWGGYGTGVSGSYGGGMSSGFGSGQGRYAGRGPKGYQRSDDRIKEDINERLTQHPEIDASEIDVQVRSGEITLTGTVDDRNAKRLAEDVAEGVSGVREVHNQIRVKQQDYLSGASQSGTAGTTQAGTPVGSTKTR